MGIEERYHLGNPDKFDGWKAEIQNWGSLHRLVIWLPKGDEYGDYWAKNLRGAKIIFTKTMNIKGAIWLKDKL